MRWAAATAPSWIVVSRGRSPPMANRRAICGPTPGVMEALGIIKRQQQVRHSIHLVGQQGREIMYYRIRAALTSLMGGKIDNRSGLEETSLEAVAETVGPQRDALAPNENRSQFHHTRHHDWLGPRPQPRTVRLQTRTGAVRQSTRAQSPQQTGADAKPESRHEGRRDGNRARCRTGVGEPLL
jgi:hypothetical protein